ncbi:MAG TPA: hypothetical protein PLO24_04765 [Bacteroidales bacterium]|nr:hypothetical protein [Bacteroidales bacterium]HOS71005.1 hypothetical protein [Bacteroidales bacterium]
MSVRTQIKFLFTTPGSDEWDPVMSIRLHEPQIMPQGGIKRMLVIQAGPREPPVKHRGGDKWGLVI